MLHRRLPLLFNVATDVSEQHDVALSHPGVTQKLLCELGYWGMAGDTAVRPHKQARQKTSKHGLTAHTALQFSDRIFR